MRFKELYTWHCTMVGTRLSSACIASLLTEQLHLALIIGGPLLFELQHTKETHA